MHISAHNTNKGDKYKYEKKSNTKAKAELKLNLLAS